MTHKTQKLTQKQTAPFTLSIIMATMLLAPVRPATAIPVLQLYSPGAEYNGDDESWDINFTEGVAFEIWAVGNTGAVGTISDVHMTFAYQDPAAVGGGPVNITLTPILINGNSGSYMGFNDPAPAPSDPNPPSIISTDGSTPTLNSGQSLPTHGVYGSPGGITTHWQQFDIGDFDLVDSSIADFIGTDGSTATPPPHPTQMGQINAYEVLVTGTENLHIELYNHIEQGGKNHTKSKFAPFSHDANALPDGEPPADAKLGDRVWNDLDEDGIQDGNEPGVEGVKVTLTGGGADGMIGSGGDDTMDMVFTDSNGLYLFENLNPGEEYKVTFSQLPAGFEFTLLDQGPDDTVDSDADPITGMTQIVTLMSEEMNFSLDAGIFDTTPPGNPIPEPSAWMLAALAALGMIQLNWRTKRNGNRAHTQNRKSTK